MKSFLLSFLLIIHDSTAFNSNNVIRSNRHSFVSNVDRSFGKSTNLYQSAQEAAVSVDFDPKEMVKVFGRLADKYILLDSSGGMCCYSACTDCEYRLPDGGYRMADQTSSRPKWICAYDERKFESSGKEHESKWGIDIFTSGPAVTKDEFVSRLLESKYNPTLGGPFVSASSAKIEDATTHVAEIFFDILAGEKEKLTKHRMGTRIKELAGGEEGMTWKHFSAALTGDE